MGRARVGSREGGRGRGDFFVVTKNWWDLTPHTPHKLDTSMGHDCKETFGIFFTLFSMKTWWSLIYIGMNLKVSIDLFINLNWTVFLWVELYLCRSLKLVFSCSAHLRTNVTLLILNVSTDCFFQFLIPDSLSPGHGTWLSLMHMYVVDYTRGIVDSVQLLLDNEEKLWRM